MRLIPGPLTLLLLDERAAGVKHSAFQTELTLGLRLGSAPGTRAYNRFLPIMKK